MPARIHCHRGLARISLLTRGLARISLQRSCEDLIFHQRSCKDLTRGLARISCLFRTTLARGRCQSSPARTALLFHQRSLHQWHYLLCPKTTSCRRRSHQDHPVRSVLALTRQAHGHRWKRQPMNWIRQPPHGFRLFPCRMFSSSARTSNASRA